MISLLLAIGLSSWGSACIMPAMPSAALRAPAPRGALLKSFRWLNGDRQRTDRYDRLIEAQARLHRLDPRLVKAIIAAESGFSAKAVSPAGARGLMQVMPATAREMGIQGDLHDPTANIKAGTAYLELLHRAAWHRYGIKGKRYEDTPEWLTRRIIAAYNAGPRALGGKGWVRETRGYVEKVSFYHRTEMAGLRRSFSNHAAAR
jgi:soluble lytic murein transglycosylase-like protein